eukprot:1159120-Pelagomonas_calceolata.AAC.1
MSDFILQAAVQRECQLLPLEVPDEHPGRAVKGLFRVASIICYESMFFAQKACNVALEEQPGGLQMRKVRSNQADHEGQMRKGLESKRLIASLLIGMRKAMKEGKSWFASLEVLCATSSFAQQRPGVCETLLYPHLVLQGLSHAHPHASSGQMI